MTTVPFDVFISILLMMYRLVMYIFSYYCSAWIALIIVLYTECCAIVIALLINDAISPSPVMGHYIGTIPCMMLDVRQGMACEDWL